MKELEVYNIYAKCQRMCLSCKTDIHATVTRKYIRMARDYIDSKYGSSYTNGTDMFSSSFKRHLFWHREFDGLMYMVGV